MFPHVVRIRETGTQAQIETENVEFPEMETPSVPDAVPTAQSSDDEIREFEAWLSSILTEEDTPEKTEMEDLQVETDEIDYELEISHIKFVIEDQWKNSLISYDIDGYMSAIWDDSFFYASDMGTPNNPDDDIIFRGGQEEREGALKMFNAHDDIDLNLYKNGDVEFLSETLAMVDYDYRLKLVSERGTFYPAGRMIFIFELREGGYWAEVPAIEGCATQGDTFEELLEYIYEAIEARLECTSHESTPNARVAFVGACTPQNLASESGMCLAYRRG